MLGKDLNTVPNVWSSIRAGRTSRLHWNEWFNGRPCKKTLFWPEEIASCSPYFTDREVGARGAGSILLLFFQSSQSTLETLRLAQRAEPLLSGTPTLVNVQGFSCCSQSLGTLFLARLSCVLSSLHVLFFLKGVSRPLPYPGRCPTCHIGRYKSQPFNYQS